MGGTMNLLDRLRRMAESVPPGGSVTIPRDWLVAELDQAPAAEPQGDLTVAEAGKILGRAASTVRVWCHGELIPGAYLYRNREYRIPPAALAAFQEAERTRKRGERNTPPAGQPANLGAWRDLKRAS